MESQENLGNDSPWAQVTSEFRVLHKKANDAIWELGHFEKNVCMQTQWVPHLLAG